MVLGVAGTICRAGLSWETTEMSQVVARDSSGSPRQDRDVTDLQCNCWGWAWTETTWTASLTNCWLPVMNPQPCPRPLLLKVSFAVDNSLKHGGSETCLAILKLKTVGNIIKYCPIYQIHLNLNSKPSAKGWGWWSVPECMGLGWPLLREDLWLLRRRRPPVIATAGDKTEGGGGFPMRVNKDSISSFWRACRAWISIVCLKADSNQLRRRLWLF